MMSMKLVWQAFLSDICQVPERGVTRCVYGQARMISIVQEGCPYFPVASLQESNISTLSSADPGRRLPTVLMTLQVMNWNSHHIEEAISDCYKVSKAVAETQAAVKGHESRIKAILSAWSSKLIVERKSGQVFL